MQAGKLQTREIAIHCEKVIEIEQSYGFRMMVFPRYKYLLDFNSSNQPTLIIKASIDDKPAGLVIGVFTTSQQLEIVSIFVPPQFRQKGVAEQLLIDLEKESQVNATTELIATYMTEQTTTPYLEKLFFKRNFTQPITRMLLIRYTIDSVKRIPWLNGYQLPDGYEIKKWLDLSNKERTEIVDSNKKEHWVADDLSPFKFEKDIEPITSLALLVNGKVRCWCLNHIVDNKLRFTCSFAHIALQRTGRVILLLKHILEVIPATGLTEGMCTIPIALHPRMAQFMTRRLKPYTTFFAETRSVRKQVESTV